MFNGKLLVHKSQVPGCWTVAERGSQLPDRIIKGWDLRCRSAIYLSFVLYYTIPNHTQMKANPIKLYHARLNYTMSHSWQNSCSVFAYYPWLLRVHFILLKLPIIFLTGSWWTNAALPGAACAPVCVVLQPVTLRLKRWHVEFTFWETVA